jgi:hypothetical protein
VEITPPTPLAAFDPMWAAAFDEHGNAVEHWAGNAAVSITK